VNLLLAVKFVRDAIDAYRTMGEAHAIVRGAPSRRCWCVFGRGRWRNEAYDKPPSPETADARTDPV
jgi:hypothetical protein